MHLSTCQHREQHISERNDEIAVLHEITIFRLEPQRWPLEFVNFFSQVHTFGVLGLGLVLFMTMYTCNPNRN